jgi:hypothetical protein
LSLLAGHPGPGEQQIVDALRRLYRPYGRDPL